MSSSTSSLKFLLDENVRVELFQFLKDRGLDAKVSPKSSSDRTLALISKRKKRIFVTNDEDFYEYTKDKIYSVVWLRIPQNDPETLIKSFAKLNRKQKSFKGKLIVLEPGTWDAFPLAEEIKLQ